MMQINPAVNPSKNTLKCLILSFVTLLQKLSNVDFLISL